MRSIFYTFISVVGWFFFFLLMTRQSNLQANISQSFSESIPFLASGNYVYDTLDFLTTPFLYGNQKKDAVSLKFTRRNGEGRQDRKEGLFGAARTSILNFPIYWTVNLIARNTTANVDPPINQADAEVLTERSETNYRFMLGSHFKGLGVAGYVIFPKKGKRRSDQLPPVLKIWMNPTIKVLR